MESRRPSQVTHWRIRLPDDFTEEQLTETVRRHFAGQTNLTLATVDLAALGGMVRWEVSRNGQLFPHVYGQLTPASIIARGPLEWGADGVLLLPSVLT